MWVNQNFLLQEDVNAEADGINLAFVSLRGSGPFHFRMDNSGQVNIVFKSILHMYCCGTRKSHQRTRIIRQKRGSPEFLTKLLRSEGGISLSHNNTS